MDFNPNTTRNIENSTIREPETEYSLFCHPNARLF